jgi:ATP-dependent RNA helicase DHX36
MHAAAAAAAAHATVRPARHQPRPRLSSRGAFSSWGKVPARFAVGSQRRSVNRQTRAVFAAVVEPATKVTFPDTYNTHDNTKVMKCLGCGVRQKKIAIINVKVYAVAMYVDAEACKKTLLEGSTLLDGNFHKALLVQLVRNVDGKTFWEALDAALVPRIREIATNMATAEDADGNFMASVAEAAEAAEEAALDGVRELREMFSGANLKKDSRVLINWKPGGRSMTSVTGFEGTLEVGVVGGDVTVELKSMELARALFDVYLGDAPVSPGAKSDIEAGARKL